MNVMDKEVGREEGGGMGRQAKLGLAVIALLLVVFVAALVIRIKSPNDLAAAPNTRTSPGQSVPPPADPKLTGIGRTWPKAGGRSAAANRPIVASPKSAPRASEPRRLRSWPSASDNKQGSAIAGTSPEQLMMPDVSAGASGVKVLPSPTLAAQWPNQSAPVAQSPPAPVPPDPFDRSTGRGYASSSSAYPSPPGSYASPSGSPYSYYPSGSSAPGWSTSADRNSVRQHHAAYPPDDSSSPRDYRRGEYPSDTSHDAAPYDYRAAPHAEKMTRPYEMPNRMSSGSSSGYYGSTSYGNDRSYPRGSPGAYSSLGGRREDGKYVVGPNGNFWTISEELYGTGAYFQALAEINKARFPDRDRLRVGDVILAPQIAELEEKYPDLCPSPERRKVIHERMSTVSTRTNYHAGPVYVVQEGDTLYDIARFKLGSGMRWPEIYELNLGALQGDFDYVTPGTELTLPEQPADAVTQRPASDGPRW